MNSDKLNYTPSRGEFHYRGVLWNEYTTLDILKDIERFEFLPSDIVVNTFPRSGTTLTQEIIWHIKNKAIIKKGQKYGDIDQRFPFLEYNSKFDDSDNIYPVKILETKFHEPYRLIKTHCPWSFIGSNLVIAKPKCILVFRNPRDVCVSMFHFYQGMQLFGPWPGSWPEFATMFQNGFTKCGSWITWHHDWWTETGLSAIGSAPIAVTTRSNLSLLFYTFEMMIKNPKQVVQAIADFIGESLTQDQMEIILHNSNFRQMSTDDELNLTDQMTGFKFIRQGQIGNWKKYFTEEQIGLFQSLVEEQVEKLGMNFEYE